MCEPALGRSIEWTRLGARICNTVQLLMSVVYIKTHVFSQKAYNEQIIH